MRSRRPDSNGFSLLEVMVAMSLLGLVFLIAAALLNGATKNADYIEQADPFPEELPLFQILAEDLRHFSRVPLRKAAPALALEDMRLELHVDLPSSGLSVVSYEATDDGLQRILSPFDQSLMGQTNLVHRSETWTPRVYKGERWEERWPLETSDGVPSLLEVEVQGVRREYLIPASFELRGESSEEEEDDPEA